jgi:hypothetical protein
VEVSSEKNIPNVIYFLGGTVSVSIADLNLPECSETTSEGHEASEKKIVTQSVKRDCVTFFFAE